jgi:hypothetical protein
VLQFEQAVRVIERFWNPRERHGLDEHLLLVGASGGRLAGSPA